MKTLKTPFPHLKLLGLLIFSGGVLLANPIAFQNLEVHGKRHPLVIVNLKSNQIEYTLDGTTHTCRFEELPQNLQRVVAPYIPTHQNSAETTDSTEAPEEGKPRLNSEQLAQKAHRDLEEIIKEKLTNPESFSLTSAGFYKNDKGLALTQRFRALSAKGKKRSYTVQAQTNTDGEILSVDWGQQEL